MKKNTRVFNLLGLLALMLTASLPAVSSLEEAMSNYTKAEQSEKADERKELFNKALATFLSIDNPSGQLLCNIGNIYFYLGDDGTSIAYYRMAERLIPNDPSLEKNLHIALETAEVSRLQIERPLEDFLGFRWISVFERRLLALGAIGITLVLFSFNVWFPRLGFCWPWRLFGGATALFLLLLWLYAFFVPARAVVIHASSLRVSSGFSSKETVTTVRPGEMVEVLASASDKDWVRVRTSFGVTGYLPGKIVCFIDE